MTRLLWHRKLPIVYGQKGCDIVVCLSHLGFRIKNGVCDEKLAAETKGIDVILGGHSHTFMEKPAFFLNAEGKSIPVLHTGKNGIFCWRIGFDII